MATTNATQETVSEEPYTTHVEPPHVGGETYIQCRHCGAELLTSLGGWTRLVHREDCPHAEVA